MAKSKSLRNPELEKNTTVEVDNRNIGKVVGAAAAGAIGMIAWTSFTYGTNTAANTKSNTVEVRKIEWPDETHIIRVTEAISVSAKRVRWLDDDTAAGASVVPVDWVLPSKGIEVTPDGVVLVKRSFIAMADPNIGRACGDDSNNGNPIVKPNKPDVAEGCIKFTSEPAIDTSIWNAGTLGKVKADTGLVNKLITVHGYATKDPKCIDEALGSLAVPKGPLAPEGKMTKDLAVDRALRQKLVGFYKMTEPGISDEQAIAKAGNINIAFNGQYYAYDSAADIAALNESLADKNPIEHIVKATTVIRANIVCNTKSVIFGDSKSDVVTTGSTTVTTRG